MKQILKDLTLKKMKMNKNLYLLRGIPGAGKSTLAKQFGDSHFETDRFFMVDGEYKFDPTNIKKPLSGNCNRGLVGCN
jgi:adenylylsulfate kinase-like enzyme